MPNSSGADEAAQVVVLKEVIWLLLKENKP